MTGAPGLAPVYELTVDGTIGPVLRHALREVTAVRSRSTVVVTRPVADSDVADLVDLVGALAAHGVEVESVVERPAPDRPPRVSRDVVESESLSTGRVTEPGGTS